ncbi:MAG: histidinol dehydrogenase, partial [Pseudomonadota bacterium]
MAMMLDRTAPDFEDAFARLLSDERAAGADVRDVVTDIIADVRARGVAAVVERTRMFDRWEATAETLAFTPEEIDAASAEVPEDVRRALELAADRIRAYHVRQMPENAEWTDPEGATLGWRWSPVDAAGLYVPGGLASYPSSVLMNAIPARVAGVRDLVVCAPTPDGTVNPAVLLAAKIAGVDRVFRIGGAQAVAALAYGAGPIPRVDKITGPGNAYVAEAKRQVFGRVGIDMIAGPSEVLVIADKDNDPNWVAVDLLAQAEHDERAQSILITDDAAFGAAVEQAVERRLQSLPRGAIAGASWRAYGAVITVETLAAGADLANRIAPEHLELCVADPEALLSEIRHAGAVFLGRHTPEAIGDYVG